MNKEKFLNDAFVWASGEGMSIIADDFPKKLFMIVSPMSNFEISMSDIEKHLIKINKKGEWLR